MSCSRQNHAAADKATRSFVDAATKEHGSSARTFKSGLVWAVPEGADSLRDDARKALAWEDIADEETDLRLDDSQTRQLAENLKKAQRDIKETVWRTYKNVMLLGKDGEWKTVDLGLVHSSAAPSVGQLIINVGTWRWLFVVLLTASLTSLIWASSLQSFRWNLAPLAVARGGRGS